MTTKSLFIGQSYIDVTMIADVMPTGDEKAVARDYAVAFGGNAVTAAFACARLGHDVDLLSSHARDWLGEMFADMAARYGVRLHRRRVKRSSLSFIWPSHGKRAILRARDDKYLDPIPPLDLAECRALHIDGHQVDAAIHYARECRQRGVLTSLDGGAVRENTHELLTFIDVAIVAERFCEQMGLDSSEVLEYLKSRGCRIGGVTEGERGLFWYDETGRVQRLPALKVPAELVIDTSGAGDIFHGAYIASYLEHPTAPWREHFDFARAAAAFKIQHLGNEAGLPAKTDVERMKALYDR
jgi:sugar/nucleoside kinase (ribokinase family)